MIATMIGQWPLKQYGLNYKTSHNNTIKSNEAITNTCNAMLRGDLSAVETYTQVIEKFGKAGNVEEPPLANIRSNHRTNSESLRKLVTEYDAKPASSSGPWGTFATTVQGTAVLLGKSTALMVLQKGEEHGILQYIEALDDEELSQSAANLIRDTLLPTLREHVIQLKHMINNLN